MGKEKLKSAIPIYFHVQMFRKIGVFFGVQKWAKRAHIRNPNLFPRASMRMLEKLVFLFSV